MTEQKIIAVLLGCFILFCGTKTVFADIQLQTLDRVNLRGQPTTESNVLSVLDPLTTLTVTEILPNGWAKVVFDGQHGYVMAEYLGVKEQYAPPVQQSAASNENLKTLDRVNFREQPSTDSRVLRVLEPLSTVNVVERNANGWVRVMYDGQYGFIKAEFLGTEDQYTPPVQQNTASVETLTTLDRVNLREQPSTNSKILSVLDPLITVTVNEKQGNGWIYVTFNGQRGFIKAEFLGTRDQYVPSSQAAPSTVDLMTLERVNFRVQASTGSAVMQVLDRGTKVTVTETLSSGWVKAIFNGQTGYIKAEYVGDAQAYERYIASSQAAGRSNVEFLEWSVVKGMLKLGVPLEVTDVYSGKRYYVQSFSNGLHADVEPVTVNDTAILKATYGGKWDWSARPVLVNINGRSIAAAINGMPHASGVISTNGMDGQICLHFKNSSVHNGNMSYNSELQKAVSVAYNTYK